MVSSPGGGTGTVGLRRRAGARMGRCRSRRSRRRLRPGILRRRRPPRRAGTGTPTICSGRTGTQVRGATGGGADDGDMARLEEMVAASPRRGGRRGVGVAQVEDVDGTGGISSTVGIRWSVNDRLRTLPSTTRIASTTARRGPGRCRPHPAPRRPV